MFAVAFFSILAVTALAGTVPEQVHISLAGNDGNGNSNGMAVSWQTEENTDTSLVKYGLISGDYTFSASGVSGAYWETFNHHVVLSDLKADTMYYYVVGDADGGFSKEYKFKTAPITSSDTTSFSFGVFADLGVSHGDSTLNYLKNTMKNDVSLVWHGGDESYADDSFLHVGCATKFCYEDVYDEYMNDVQDWASMLPYMVAPGNHEVECHDPACLASKEKREKLSNFTAYNNRFHMPSQESGGVLNMWYSFNYANAHFITIDTETGYPGAAEETRYVLPCGGFGDQLTWLEADLKAANENRANRPWVFVQGHHPLYQGSKVNEDFQTAVEDMFYKYGVDIYFSGHVHSYERDYPTYRGEVDVNGYDNPRATSYLMIGGSGNDEMRNAEKDENNSKQFLDARALGKQYDVTPKEDGSDGRWVKGVEGEAGSWTAFTDKDHFGIGKVTIIDNNHLEFEYIRTTTGEVFDTVSLTRDHKVY